MLNHRGRWYCLYFIQVADVIAVLLCGRWYATRLHVTAFEGGRCYYQVADGITTFYTLFEDGRCFCQVADGIATIDGRCYCQVAGGIATTGWMIDNW